MGGKRRPRRTNEERIAAKIRRAGHGENQANLDYLKQFFENGFQPFPVSKTRKK